jgi:hypothetical protein
MVALSLTFTMRMGLLMVLFLLVFFTVNAQVDLARKAAATTKLTQIGEYMESKMEYGLRTITDYTTNNTQLLSLPVLDFEYSVTLSCGNNLAIELRSGADTDVIFNEFISCTRVNASGTIYPGERCLVTKRLNSTYVSLNLVNNCELV